MDRGGNFLKSNDQVEIIAGKDRGRVGKILKIYNKTGKALVERANMIKRHMKPSATNQQGQIVEKEAPIHVSNLMIVCPKCTKTVRVKNKVLDDGTKVRMCKKCNESIELKS
ncbi:MAG: 50S ribosomal protein L24 [Deltaproteobacteria bacterium RIFOXYD12_FULL_57_12]|nr:MAG: 50S ribosomal protein L24 [Deltaproteobacteria bacterium RIFOXYD12_FULL_57_12]